MLLDRHRPDGRVWTLALSTALGPWRKPTAVHDPGEDHAGSGDVVGDRRGLPGRRRAWSVASRACSGRSPRTRRCPGLIDTLAADATAALAAIDTARAAARARVWRLAGDHAPDHGIDADGPLIIDLDATLVTVALRQGAGAAHVQAGLRVPPVVRVRRPRRRRDRRTAGRSCCGPGTPDRTPPPITSPSPDRRLKQLPGHRAGTRPGRKVLIRTDGAGCTHAFLDWLTGQRLSYSVGFSLPDRHRRPSSTQIPEQVWTPAYDARRPDPRRRLGRRAHRAARPDRLADRDAGDRPQRTTAPRRAAAAHRRRRAPDHRVRHQHHRRPAAGPGTAAPPPRPRRGPDPDRQGHRPDEPAAARLRPEPDLVRHRRRWPSSSPPGCRLLALTDQTPDGGNPNGSGSGCSPSPPASPAPAGRSGCTWPTGHPGPSCSSPRSRRLRALAVPG